MPFSRLNAAIALLAACVGAAAHASQGGPDFSIHGFGTLSVVHSSERHADYITGLLMPDGPGYSRAWSLDPDSRVGAQLSARLDERLSGVLQVISEHRHNSSYHPRVEWANLRLKLSDAVSVRAGRIALPSFMAGDHRKVGYTIPWLRPPGEVYGLMPVSSNDGIDAIWRFEGNVARHELRAYAGSTDAKGAPEVDVRAKHAAGLAYGLETGAWSLRASYQQARLSIEGSAVDLDGFRQFGPQGHAIADRYESRDKRFRMLTLGLGYDSGSWFVLGEVARVQTHSWLGDRTGWYVGAGRGFGAFTPYLVLASVTSNSPRTVSGLDVAALPAADRPGAIALNQRLNARLSFVPVQDSIAVGVRWDFARDIAMKMQFDYIDIGAGSSGPQINWQPGFRPGGTLKLFSVALDFVF